MKAAVLTKKGKGVDAFKIQEIAKPILSEGEALIKVEAFGLNFADVMARNGLYRAAPPMPSVLGYEVVGTIEEINGEHEFKVGDRVLAFTRFGGYAEYAKADLRTIVEVQENDDAGELLALGTQGATAWYAAFFNINIIPGDNVLIHSGAGGVGTMLIQMLKNLEVNIYSTAGSDEKCKHLEEQGVLKAFNYNNEDYWNELDAVIGSNNLQVIFDAVGGTTFKNGLKRLSAGGKMVTYGAAYRTKSSSGFFTNMKMLFQFGFTNPLFLMMNSRTICGVNMLKVGDDRPEVLNICMNEVMSMYRQGLIKPLVHGLFPLEDIGKIHDDLENRKVIGKAGIRI